MHDRTRLPVARTLSTTRACKAGNPKTDAKNVQLLTLVAQLRDHIEQVVEGYTPQAESG